MSRRPLRLHRVDPLERRLCLNAQFGPAVDFPLQNAGRDVVVGDFNRDGAADFAVVELGTPGTLQVFLGQGGIAQFAALPPVPLAVNSPFGLAGGDVNGDGVLDLVATGGTSAQVLIGRPDGTFTPGVPIPGFRGASNGVLADLDGDRDLDLAVTETNGNDVAVLLNDGFGTFRAGFPPTYAVGAAPNYVSAVDLDGDRLLDLVVANKGTGTPSGGASLLRGLPGGTFAPATTLSTGPTVEAAVPADLNEDGRPDLVIDNFGNGTLTIALNTTPGPGAPFTFATGMLPVSPAAFTVAVADFDRDGHLDLALGTQGSSIVQILGGDGRGNFVPAGTAFLRADSWELKAADVNADGKPDLISLGFTSPVAEVVLNQTPVATLPALAVTGDAQPEGDAGTTALTFTVTRTGDLSQMTTVDFATIDASATAADNDYVPTSGTLTFAPGLATQIVTVTVNGDKTYESDEQLILQLSNPINGTLTRGSDFAVGTILNDDPAPPPTFSVNDVRVGEGNAGTTTLFKFTVTRSGDASAAASVDYATADGTAKAPDNDYVPTSGTLQFLPGQTDQVVIVSVTGDDAYEPDEVFSLVLKNAIGATIADDTGTCTILNDDLPTAGLSIDDVTQPEGNAGTTGFQFTVTRTGDLSGTATVKYQVLDGTATTADGDYQPASNLLTFARGVSTQTLTVLVNGDTKVEPDETFSVQLYSPSGATLTDDTGIGTIVNDDALAPPPSLSIGDVRLAEGNAGTTAFKFTVTRAGDLTGTTMVKYQTLDGTATTADGDYLPTANFLTFAPGVATQTVTVSVNGDAKVEPDEAFSVQLYSPINATIADDTGVGTILNDDVRLPPPSLSIGNVRQSEGGAASSFGFVVTRTGDLTGTTTVDYATADGTATVADADYKPTAGTLTFGPGVATQTAFVTVLGDAKIEPDEAFTVKLSNAVNGTIAGGTGTGTIVNDDFAPDRAPTARNDHAFARMSTPILIDVLENDTDPDGDPLAVVAITAGPSSGTATIVANQIRYVPNASAHGGDQLTYRISDGRGGFDTAHVTVTVLPANAVGPEAAQAAAASAAAVKATSVFSNVAIVDLVATGPNRDPLGSIGRV